ncbi:protein adenylyltransferase Fic [Lacticaseibacillus mingshuiensis]|uniref:protein adenylyltransferase n=1 Tax=Lacticaseibacillus mingshuiensis TaxID=2799574 RepID=A0ABW4CMS2_9LACO|nr:Fic family protein [Lacticaseibacillus mingshuiensis]
MLENKLGLTNAAELHKQEELLTKRRAREMFETGMLDDLEVGTFKGLAGIHHFLFQDVYEFAGKVRNVNLSKGDFQFAPRIYLEQSLAYIDGEPQANFDQIIEKYTAMNIAHPFREGNGRATRIWLDRMLKQGVGQVADWNRIDKTDYLNAMMRSQVSSGELKYLLLNALSDDFSKEVFFKSIDASYDYEGFFEFRTEDLGNDEAQ